MGGLSLERFRHPEPTTVYDHVIVVGTVVLSGFSESRGSGWPNRANLVDARTTVVLSDTECSYDGAEARLDRTLTRVEYDQKAQVGGSQSASTLGQRCQDIRLSTSRPLPAWRRSTVP